MPLIPFHTEVSTGTIAGAWRFLKAIFGSEHPRPVETESEMEQEASANIDTQIQKQNERDRMFL